MTARAEQEARENRGLMPRWQPFEGYFWSLVNKDDEAGCWPWLGTLMPSGHGKFYEAPQRNPLAHRFAYELFVGPIPTGLAVHHRCENPGCVNPAHLATMTLSEHAAMHLTKPMGATCKHGHPWTEENLYRWFNPRTQKTRRLCKTCKRNDANARYARRKLATA